MLAIMRNNGSSGLDRLFDDFWDRMNFDLFSPLESSMRQGPRVPSSTTTTTDGIMTVRVELPGLCRADVSAEIMGDVLTIRVPRAEEKDGKRKHDYEFERSWRLRGTTDQRLVEAKMSEGLLTVRVETKESVRKPQVRTVDIA